MCVIIEKKKGLDVDFEELRLAFESNPDGAGFMLWNEKNGKIFVKKGFMDYEEFEEYLKSIDENNYLKNSDIAFHFRIATHGVISEMNCHPFYPAKNNELEGWVDIAMVHNGIIPLTSSDKNISDSELFFKRYIYRFRNYLNDSYYQKLLENGIGSSKIVIYKLDKKKKLEKVFLNKEFFQVENGIYYSNLNHRFTYRYHGYNWWKKTKLTKNEKLKFTQKIKKYKLTKIYNALKRFYSDIEIMDLFDMNGWNKEKLEKEYFYFLG